jgi:hypothetical protein
MCLPERYRGTRILTFSKYLLLGDELAGFQLRHQVFHWVLPDKVGESEEFLQGVSATRSQAI